MKRKDLFIKALHTLLWSWGSEAPAEAIWGLNDLIEWIEKEYDIKLNVRFDEESINAEAVMEKLNKVL